MSHQWSNVCSCVCMCLLFIHTVFTVWGHFQPRWPYSIRMVNTSTHTKANNHKITFIPRYTAETSITLIFSTNASNNESLWGQKTKRATLMSSRYSTPMPLHAVYSLPSFPNIQTHTHTDAHTNPNPQPYPPHIDPHSLSFTPPVLCVCVYLRSLYRIQNFFTIAYNQGLKRISDFTCLTMKAQLWDATCNTGEVNRLTGD